MFAPFDPLTIWTVDHLAWLSIWLSDHLDNLGYWPSHSKPTVHLNKWLPDIVATWHCDSLTLWPPDRVVVFFHSGNSHGQAYCGGRVERHLEGKWGHNNLLLGFKMEKVIWIVNKKCLSSFFLFNQRRHVFAQIRQRRRQRRRPTSILYLSLSLSANDHFMSRRLGLEEDQLESKTKQLIPSNCSLSW